MSKVQLIEPVPGSTTPRSGTSPRRTRPLPYDLLKAASSRLRIISLLGAVLWVLGTAGGHLSARAILTETRSG